MTPADTRMMGIVHDALRRDLRRARRALATDPPPRQRAAIAAHLAWMAQFLHFHHTGEDEGLFPAVRRNPEAAALVDEMAADHVAIAPALAKLEAADLDALDELEAVLLPHLRREEDELMPLVSATLTDREWRDLEHTHFVAPKSARELGREAHWLLDGLPADRRAVVTGVLSPVPRFVVLHAFARGYRRRRAACWGTTPGADRRVQLQNRVEVHVDAPLDAVWDVVQDVTRVGEWSHECVGAVWLDGATEAVPGARFRGRNRAGLFRWGRICEIVSSEPYELAWRTVPTRAYPDSTEWTIRLRPADDGTVIEQAYRAVRAPAALAIVYGALVPAHRDRTLGLVEDLEHLGEVAAA